MKRAAIAGFAAGAAMMIGGALGAVTTEFRPDTAQDTGMMNPMIGGQAMLPDHNILDNLDASPLHTRMSAALKDTGVGSALTSRGKFTVFAPTDAAFVTAGNQPRPAMARRMSYLIVPGTYDSTTLLRMINEGGGEARLRTAEGGVLVARMNGPTNIMLMDEKGNTANIAVYDIRDRNGVIQVIDRMMEPSGTARQVASSG